jgi:hypothetical protein
MHDVADTLHVEDHEILTVGIDDAFEFADHLGDRRRCESSS